MNNNQTFVQEIKTNLSRYIKKARASGVTGMTIGNLLQVVKTPSRGGGATGNNARWVYEQIFRNICEASHSSFILR